VHALKRDLPNHCGMSKIHACGQRFFTNKRVNHPGSAAPVTMFLFDTSAGCWCRKGFLLDKSC
jgi:hypothetical protein